MTLKYNTRSSHAKLIDMLMILVLVVSACLPPARVTSVIAQTEGVSNTPINTSNIFTLETKDLPIVEETEPVTGTTTLVSISSEGIQANNYSQVLSISADGRFVAIESYASNLVHGDTNSRADVFVHDRHTGETSRVSVSSEGVQGDADSLGPSISADGRYVSFYSRSTNLDLWDRNGEFDVFVHDRQSGETSRVSVSSWGAGGGDESITPSISADGNYVAFSSWAPTLVSGDTNGKHDIFVHDRQTGETTRVSVSSGGVQGNEDSALPSISADGRYVSFISAASNLVSNDNNAKNDVFVHDRLTGETSIVSVSSGGNQGNGNSFFPSTSPDGRYVVFYSDASNLVSEDTNGRRDVFVHELYTGETARVSLSSEGIQGDQDSSGRFSIISADNRYVVFNSASSNLVVGDSNNASDIFVHDRNTGKTTLVSVSYEGFQGNSSSVGPSISADGRFVAFSSYASNLVSGDDNNTWDVFVHDRGVLPDLPVNITDMEINQALGVQKDGEQNYVAGKSTVIRVFLDAKVNVDPLTQRVVVSAFNITDPTVLYPNNFPGKTNVLEFYCPPSDPVCGSWPADNYMITALVGDQSLGTNVIFSETESVKIHVIPVTIVDGYEFDSLSDDEWKSAYKFLEQTYPVADNNIEWSIGHTLVSGIPGLPWIRLMLMENLVGLSYFYQLQGKELVAIMPPRAINCDDRCTYGWNATFFNYSVVFANGSFSYQKNGETITTTIDNMQAIIAHEYGHSKGLGEEYEDASSYHCSINPPPRDIYNCNLEYQPEPWEGNSTGSKISKDEHHPFEVNGRGALTDKLSFMGGGRESQYNYWISPDVYSHLFNQMQVDNLSSVKQMSDNGRVIVASGWVNTTDEITITPWYHFDAPLPELKNGEYSIDAKDVDGNTLATQNFDISFIVASNPPTISDEAFFQTSLTFPEGTDYFVIRHGLVELTQIEVNAIPPSVLLISPNGGEVWNSGNDQTIRWDGVSDGSVHYTLLLSTDGIEWQVIASNLTDTEYLLNTSYISGSDNAVVKILATDGINTVEDVSDGLFSISHKPPDAHFFYPAQGETIPYEKTIILDGNGFDLEDGIILDNHVSWYSNIDGLLGTGSQLPVDLGVGHHVITLQVEDSDANLATAEIEIDIVPCYSLSIAHVGSGTDPVAMPESSTVCPAGMYLEGEAITLTSALPDPGWYISGWSGTDNDLSIESSNSLTMPAYDHTVAVNYSVIVPEIPALSSPDDAWKTDDETPTFTWSAANGADRYQIQISGLSAFTPTIQNVTLGSGILTYTADLLENGTYYWRVRGIGLADNPGDWSSARSFTIGNSPGTFTKTAPAESAADVSLSPVLSWAESSGAASYQYCVDTTDDDDCSNWVDNGTGTSVQLNNLPENTTHYWQVKAINEFGTAYADAASTAFWSFTTGALPVAFSKTSPADNTTSVSIDPGISWEESVGADRYEYCIDTTDDNDCSTWVNNGTETSVTLTSLNSNTTYYWQVKAINSIGSVYANGDGAAFWTFTTRPGPVNFGKTSPADGEIGLSMSPGLFWQPSADATAYEYCYDTTDDDDCSSWVENGTETSTALADLAPNTTYYWQVRALDANGSTYGDHGDWWSFSTINFTPAIEQKLAASMVTFNWDDIPGATQYKLQLSLSSTFSTVIFTKTLTVSEFAYGIALTNGKTYYWRIQPYLNGAWGAWYPTWRFYSMNPPLAPSSTSLVPAAGAFFRVNVVDFSWGDVANDDHYQLQISETLDFAEPLVADVTDLDRETRTYQATGLVDDLYYWHVRAIDEVGVPGAWSLTRSFTVDTDAPDAPGLKSPAADTSTYDTTPYLSVNAVLGAKWYRFKVVQGGNCEAEGVIPTSPDLLTTSWTVTPALPYSDDLYWCAQSIDAAGNESPWSESEARRLIVTFQSLPKADASTADTTPTFSWYAVPGALGYDLIIEPAAGEDNPATEGYVVSLGAVRSYTLPNIKALEPGGVYHWRLRAHTASGSQESPLRRLTIAPPAPTLSLPLTAKYVNTATPSLEWNGVSGAAYYEIWVDTSTYFNTPNGQKWFTADAGTSYTPDETEALGEAKYYWKVRAVNYDGTPGAFSAYRYFTVDSKYPDATLLKLPAASAVVYGTPTFSWATAAGARSYRLEIDIDGGSFEEPIYERAGLTVLSHKPARVMFGVYNWRVWAVDAAGNETPSEVRRVFVFPLTPGGTTLISPPNAAFVNDVETPLELKWNTVPYADHYEILVDDSPLLTTPAYTHTVYFGGTSHTIPSGLLPDDTKYYWKVRAVNSAETPGSWSAVRSFTVDRSDPEVPALVSPGDGETSPLGTPTFRWNASGGAKYYELVIDEVGGDFSDPVFYSRSKLTVLYHKPTVAMSGNYQWKVIATDLAGNSSESAPWTITVNPLKPGTPVLVSPVSGYMVNDEKVDFELTWKTVPYAATYNILVDDDPLFKSPVSGYPMSISGTSYKITDLLPLDNTKYYWKVQAVNSAGISLWSAYRYFTVDRTAPSAPPVLRLPVYGAYTYDTTPALSVNAVTGARWYCFQVARDEYFADVVVNPGCEVKSISTGWSVPSVSALEYGQYWWRAQAIDAAGNITGWSDPARVFTVTFQRLPSHAFPTGDTTPTFSWYAVPGAGGYQLEVEPQGTDDNTATAAYSVYLGAVTSHTIPNIRALDPGEYQWRLRVYTAAGVKESPWRELVILPPAPRLISPDNNAVLPLTFPLAWEAVPGAESYQIQLSTSSYFTNPLLFDDIVENEEIITLTAAGKYYWRVRAKGCADAYGAWSAYRIITVNITN